jgi:hypothetical protein
MCGTIRATAPVSTFRIRVEQAQIRDEVLLVVDGQRRIERRGIGNIRSSGGQCRIWVIGVGVMQALHRHKPKARPAPPWKAPKVYRFIIQ